MYPYFAKVIGAKDESRKYANLSRINEVDGLKYFLNSDFDEWLNFDRCEGKGVQQ